MCISSETFSLFEASYIEIFEGLCFVIDLGFEQTPLALIDMCVRNPQAVVICFEV